MRTRPSSLAGLLPALAAAGSCFLFTDAVDAQTATPDDFNPGVDGIVEALAIQADGKILVGGEFSTAAGEPRTNLVRLNPDGSLDPGFDPGPNHRGSRPSNVSALAVQADGGVLVGGDFTLVGGQARTNIGRLNTDGSLDSGFNPGESGGNFPSVDALAVQVDGKILVGGTFTTLAGQRCNSLGRLHPDGSMETAFGAGLGGSVYALALQADGAVLVGGSFTKQTSDWPPRSRTNLLRLYPRGTNDQAFTRGPDGPVFALALQADGKILVGGRFTKVGGQARTNISRLQRDGTLDSAFNPGAVGAAYASVNCLAVQADGKILVGGSFTNLAGQPRKYFGRLHPGGALDHAFDAEADGWVNSVVLQPDGRILVGGWFTNLSGVPRRGIGRLNNTDPPTPSLSHDGSTITWLRGGTSPEVWRTTFELSTNGSDWTFLGQGSPVFDEPEGRTIGWELSSTSILASATIRARGYFASEACSAGSFVESYAGLPVVLSPPIHCTSEAGTTATFNVVASGSEPMSYQWLKDGVPLADGGNIAGAQTLVLTLADLVGGETGSYRLVVSNGYGSVTSQAATLRVLNPKIVSQPVSQYRNAGERVTFSVTAEGTPPLSYQWWKAGEALPDQTGSSLDLTNVRWADTGAYWVVVSNIYGSVTSTPASLSFYPSLDVSFNPSPNDSVHALAVQADGKILVGGSFRSLGGQERRYIGRLNGDGRLDPAFDPSSNIMGWLDSVWSLAVMSDGKILVGSTDVMRGQLWRFNPEGTADSCLLGGGIYSSMVYSLAVRADGGMLVSGWFPLNAQRSDGLLEFSAPDYAVQEFPLRADARVVSVAIQPDGRILVGGWFARLREQSRRYIGRVHPDGELDIKFNPEANWAVFALAVQPDGKILVAGGFTTLANQPCRGIGRLHSDGSLDREFSAGVNGAVSALGLQADGKILVAGDFTTLCGQDRHGIGRLNPDGSLDAGFNLDADDSVWSVAVQADGKILVGGEFARLGGEPRKCIGRFNNTEPATQSLRRGDSTLTWLRGGSCAEVWRTTFEACTNGVDWFLLGVGQRIPGGWQVTGVTLPPQTAVRARGYVTGGIYNGSSWFVESTALVSGEVQPRILSAGVDFGFAAGQFGFGIGGTIGGAPGQAVVAEASSNLVDWLPVSTNVLGKVPVRVIDTESSALPHRFYRLRLVE